MSTRTGTPVYSLSYQRALVALPASALFLTFSHSAASGTTYSVCPSGCDYSSINTAVDNALDPGVTINVSPGIYRELMTIVSPHNGTSGSPAVMRASGGAVIVDG